MGQSGRFSIESAEETVEDLLAHEHAATALDFRCITWE